MLQASFVTTSSLQFPELRFAVQFLTEVFATFDYVFGLPEQEDALVMMGTDCEQRLLVADRSL